MKNRVLKFLTLGAALCGMSAWAAVAKIGNAEYDTLKDACDAAANNDVISLEEAQVNASASDVLNGLKDKTVTIQGKGVSQTTMVSWGTGMKTAVGANITFKDMTITADHTGQAMSYTFGIQHASSETYVNCTLNGQVTVMSPNSKFVDCVVNGTPSEYSLWVYYGTCTCENTVFNDGGTKAMVKLYAEENNPCNAIFKNCTFNDPETKTSDWKGAPVYISNKNNSGNDVVYNVTIENCTYPDCYENLAKDGNKASNITVVEPPAEENTRVDNFFADETPPTAYVEELSEEEAAAENMECEFVFRAWSESDFAIFEKCYDRSSHSFDLDALTAAEKARFEEVAAAIEPYAGCHADFVVKFDRPVKANSVMLKGNYGNYGWQGFELTRDMAAGDELRLLNDGVEGLQIRFSYQMILTDVVEFFCGAVNLSAANFGTTMTVDLRLYEPVTSAGDKEISNYDPETGRYMVIGTYSHTFKDPNYREVRLSTADSVLKDAAGAAISAPTAAQSGILAAVQGTVGANTPSEDMTGTGVIPAAQAAVTDAGDAAISGYVKIRLDAVQVTMQADSTAALKSIAYDVTPMAIITRVEGGETTVTEQEIPNDKITAPITFRLPVTAEFVKGARITHDSDADRFAKIETEDGKRFVTVSADHFSVFTLYPDDVAEAAVASSNIMAVKRVPGGSPRAEVVAPVPWKRLDDVTKDMTVARLVATGRANADELAVWNESRRGYDVWRWSESQGAWEAGMTTDKTPVTSPAAETTTLKQGAAVWFKRGTPAAAYSEIGGYTSGNVTSKPVSGMAANTLMINPYFKDVVLSDIVGSTGDQIQIISTKKVYVWKGSWGSMKIVDQVTPFGTFKTEQFVAETAPIVLPAGEGFWYISRGGTPTVDWKALEPTTTP